LLLDRLMDADVTVVDLHDMHELAPLLEAKADEVRRAGGRPFVVQPFGVDTLAMSAVGYVNAVLELDEQLAAANIVAYRLYLAGATLTPAGIMLGLKALGRATRVVSICPIRWEDDRAADIARIAAAAAALLGLSLRCLPGRARITRRWVRERPRWCKEKV